MPELLTIDAALGRIVDNAQLLPVETVAVTAAIGRVVREPATARVELPPFPSSAMDGFAVRASETPGELPIAYRVAAGSPPPGPLPTGAAAGISTGGTVPAEADAVVPVEIAEDLGSSVVIAGAAVPGQHVRPRGGDVGAGATVVPAGARLGAAQIGALAATGVAELACSRRPRVTVVATGSELRSAGDELAAGQIYESNRAMIAAVLARANADVDVLPVVEDDAEAHREAIARGLESDVLVTTGGVSMGEHDLVRGVAADLGVEEIFWASPSSREAPLFRRARPHSRLRPARQPGVLARRSDGLRDDRAPRPAGGDEQSPRYTSGITSKTFRRNPHRDEFVRAVRIDGEDAVRLEPIVGQESHMIARAAAADALVHVPRGEGELEAGSLVRFLALD